MSTFIYATIGDTVENFVNKKGEQEARTIEGPTVIKDIVVAGPADFQAKYSAIQVLYPGSIVRFQKASK
jgi:hypothetical protein